MIVFKPLYKDDLLLLYQWFQEPTINQLYARGQAWSFKDIENKYLPRLTGHDNVPSFIIYSDHKPIGFIQYYCLSEHYPEVIPTLAKIWHEVLGSLWVPDISIERVEQRFHNHINDSTLPLTLVSLKSPIWIDS